MEKIKTLLPIALVGLSLILGSLLFTSTPSTQTGISQGITRHEAICLSVNRWTPDGYIYEEPECTHSVLFSIGGNHTVNLLLGKIPPADASTADNVSFIAVGNGTDPASGDTTLNNEIAESGLTRAYADSTKVDATTGNATLYKLFTFTGTGPCVINTTALFNASSGGIPFVGGSFTSRTLYENDQPNITAHFWVT